MCDCCASADRCVAFFDTLAETWDSMHDCAVLGACLDAGIKRFGIGPQEHIMDVGCGTGNLTAALLRALSPAGKITAVDLSSRMIEIARSKADDSRIRWILGPIEHLDPSHESFDRIICFSVWPHLADPFASAQLFHSMLAPGGALHIWHLISREAVNKIHSEASEAIHDHLLAPATQTARLLEQAGFTTEETQDDEAGYLVTGRKNG
jgi:ubiquinone/menaquinone biosynthesis C-methylase UbiE